MTGADDGIVPPDERCPAISVATGGPCKTPRMVDHDYCYHHRGQGEFRRIVRVPTGPPLDLDSSGVDELPDRQRDAMTVVRQEHAQTSLDPACKDAALTVEPCGHGGRRWTCWGCREIVAGIGQPDDPCLDRYRVRASDSGSGTLLCSPVPEKRDRHAAARERWLGLATG